MKFLWWRLSKTATDWLKATESSSLEIFSTWLPRVRATSMNLGLLWAGTGPNEWSTDIPRNLCQSAIQRVSSCVYEASPSIKALTIVFESTKDSTTMTQIFKTQSLGELHPSFSIPTAGMKKPSKFYFPSKLLKKEMQFFFRTPNYKYADKCVYKNIYCLFICIC